MHFFFMGDRLQTAVESTSWSGKERAPWLNFRMSTRRSGSDDNDLFVQVSRSHFSLCWTLEDKTDGLDRDITDLLNACEASIGFRGRPSRAISRGAVLFAEGDDEGKANLERYELPGDFERYTSDLKNGKDYLLLIRLETNNKRAVVVRRAQVSAADWGRRFSSPRYAEFSAEHGVSPPLEALIRTVGAKQSEAARRKLVDHMKACRSKVRSWV